MAEKKNIVIKLKFPRTGTIPEQSSFSPKVITEWNVKRIGIALGSIAIITALVLYFSFFCTQKLTIGQTTASSVAVSTVNVEHSVKKKFLDRC